MNTTQQEWQHIEVYESGKRDQARTILNLFEGQLPEDVKRWLRIEIEVNDERIEEAKTKAQTA